MTLVDMINDRTITVHMEDGIVIDVSGLPHGWSLRVFNDRGDDIGEISVYKVIRDPRTSRTCVTYVGAWYSDSNPPIGPDPDYIPNDLAVEMERINEGDMKCDILPGWWWDVNMNSGYLAVIHNDDLDLAEVCSDNRFDDGESACVDGKIDVSHLDDDDPIVIALTEACRPYCPEGTPSNVLFTEATCVYGFGARLSMPGYLDSTDWTLFKTAREAAEYLVETYGDSA